MRVLNCRDVGFDCEGQIQGANDEEILRQAAEHVKSTHNLTVTPEQAAEIQTKIKDATASAS